jgi:hypothetical protein
MGHICSVCKAWVDTRPGISKPHQCDGRPIPHLRPMGHICPVCKEWVDTRPDINKPHQCSGRPVPRLRPSGKPQIVIFVGHGDYAALNGDVALPQWARFCFVGLPGCVLDHDTASALERRVGHYGVLEMFLEEAVAELTEYKAEGFMGESRLMALESTMVNNSPIMMAPYAGHLGSAAEQGALARQVGCTPGRVPNLTLYGADKGDEAFPDGAGAFTPDGTRIVAVAEGQQKTLSQLFPEVVAALGAPRNRLIDFIWMACSDETSDWADMSEDMDEWPGKGLRVTLAE